MAKNKHQTTPTLQSLTILLMISLLIVGAVYYCREIYNRGNRALFDFRMTKEEIRGHGECNLFAGKWVHDNKSYPLYEEEECKFMFDDLACGKYGRRDIKYQHWRWQPKDCDLPRFNATAFLEMLRGKRLVFVGDSVNRNQWGSLVCLVQSSIPKGLKRRRLKGNLYSFKAKEYNATIDFYWEPLLVESNSDDPSNHHFPERIVKIQSIEKHAKNWASADILIFNSYHWWRKPKLKVLWSESEIKEGVIYEEVESLECYKMALKTWSDWVYTHVNHAGAKLFWVSMSPSHSRSEDWGMPTGLRCYYETEPITKQAFRRNQSDVHFMQITEAAIRKLKAKGLKIHVLNITQLSGYRKDAHPSVYRKQWRPLSTEQLANRISYSDCTHWCLPGVPDTWNQLLYAYLFHYNI